MADDAAGLRGFAQVVTRTRNNNNLILQLAQRQRQSEQEFELKQRESALKAFDELSNNIYTAKLNPELEKAQQDSLKMVYSGLNEASRQINTGNYAGARETQNRLKQTHDMFIHGLESIQGAVTDIEKVISSEKSDLFNKEKVGQKLNDLQNKSLIRENGQVVGVDFEQAANLNKFFEDPDLYSDQTITKRYVDDLAKAAIEREVDSYGSTESQSATKDFYEIDKDGRIKLNKDTGLPVPKASPQAIYAWDQDEIRKQKLDKWAETNKITRSEAFKKFVVKPYGQFEQKITTKDEPAHKFTQREKELNATERYKTLRSIVDNYDESALAQGFNVNDRMKVEFSGGGSKGNLPGETKPDEIVVYKREVIQPDPNDPSAVKYSDWMPTEYIPIRNDQQKDVAIFKLNTILDAAGEKTGLSIGNDAIRKIHNQRKNQKPIDLGVPWD